MSPSPEKIEGQQPATEHADATAKLRTGRGLRVEARVTSPTWEIGLSGVVHDFTPGEVILLLDDHVAEGTHVMMHALNPANYQQWAVLDIVVGVMMGIQDVG